MGMIKQASKQHGESRESCVVGDEVREIMRRPAYIWPKSYGRLDFCSKYNRKPLESYKQSSKTIFMIKTIIVSETKKLSGTELDED